MRYAMIMAGGSGTRLWPMSRADRPKQLIPFIHGKSLLEVALDRLDGLVDADRQYICAGRTHCQPIIDALDGFPADRYLAEPQGRDTLNAVGYAATVIHRRDPDAVIAVFTADHIIEPVDRFQKIVRQGYELAEQRADTLVTFGITPTHAATAYGYLQLGQPIDGTNASAVVEFKEKPPPAVADEYYAGGPSHYLWNSGMFVWRAATLLDCIQRFEPDIYDGLTRIAEAWDGEQRDQVLDKVYPTLKKISVDYAVMEPASRDAKATVAAIPMPLTWLDVGSWPAFAQTCDHDENGNALAAGKSLMLETTNTLVASSDNGHLIATIGCDDLCIVHTPDATLVCSKEKAEHIRQLHKLLGEQFGDEYL